MADAAALKAAANALFGKKKYPQAIEKYTQALAAPSLTDDEAAVILSNRSAAYTLLSKFDLAVADARHAAERRPNWAKAQVRLAEALSRKHAFQPAQVAWQLAIDYSENDEDRQRYEKSRDQAKVAGEAAAAKNKPRFDGWRTVDSVENAWYNKLDRAAREGRASMPGLGLQIAVHAWQECENSWRAIDQAVAMQANGETQMQLFSPTTLAGLTEAILTFQSGFHVSWTPQDGKPLLTKLSNLMQYEAEQGDFKKFFDGSWSAERAINDLDARIPRLGRERVRRIAASVIYSRIIGSFLAMSAHQWGQAIETSKFALELLEAGNAKWAHESLDVRGRIFSPTIVRNVKMEIMRNVVHGHQNGRTQSAKEAFSLEEMEKWARAVLDHEVDEDYWSVAGEGMWYRGAYDHMPRWEATATLGLISNNRAIAPIQDAPAGKVLFADVEQAKQSAKHYDATAELMPDDFPDKRVILFFALYGHLRAGGLRVAAIRARFAQIEHIDSLVAPYFGPIPSFVQRTFCLNQHNALEQIPPQVVVRPIPTFRCPPGRNPHDFISEQTWQGLEGDAGVVDIISTAG